LFPGFGFGEASFEVVVISLPDGFDEVIVDELVAVCGGVGPVYD
jgi:hypothetical protein